MLDLNNKKEINQQKEEAALEAGFDLSQMQKGNCVRCRLPARPRCATPAGLREYEISGLCEECFDMIFS